MGASDLDPTGSWGRTGDRLIQWAPREDKRGLHPTGLAQDSHLLVGPGWGGSPGLERVRVREEPEGKGSSQGFTPPKVKGRSKLEHVTSSDPVESG